jgi:L,D-peptidoglycan transpeptidase YkuD (ErfK/YbiS/YcfS/YnhG family)
MPIEVCADGTLIWQGKTYRCALGKNGLRHDKKERDNATPVGRYAIRRVLYRPDKISGIETGLDTCALEADDGWCDDPAHPEYNTPVKLPFTASHEVLWRDDHIYDIIVILGHNDDPPIPGKGSAIFFHLARENYEGTEGCIAVKLEDMLEILKSLPSGEFMEIRP